MLLLPGSRNGRAVGRLYGLKQRRTGKKGDERPPLRESILAIGSGGGYLRKCRRKYENKDIRSRERPPVPCEPAVGRCGLLADPKVGPHCVPGGGQRVRQVVQPALRLQPLHCVPSHVRPCGGKRL